MSDLTNDAIDGDEHEEEHDFRPPQHLEKFLTKERRNFDDARRGCVEGTRADHPAVELLQEVRAIAGDDLDHLQLERFLGRDAGALTDGSPGPLDITMALLSDGFDIAGGEVRQLLAYCYEPSAR